MRIVAGFSLVEVLVAMGILATGLLAMSHVMASAIAINAAARNATFATALAAQKAEELRASPGASSSADYLDEHGAVRDRNGAVYSRRWAVHPVPGASTGLLIVQVVVEPLVAAAWRTDPARVVTVISGAPP